VWLATQRHRPNHVHLVTMASVRALAAHLDASDETRTAHRRFRANVVLDAAPGEMLEAFAEERVTMFTRNSGQALTFEVSSRCARCIMIDVDPDTEHTEERFFAGTKKLSAQRYADKEAYFGMYARPRVSARLAVGDVLAAELRG